MKKLIFLFVVLFSGSIVLSGCSSKQAANNVSDAADQGKPGEFRRPDFGQPEREPDIKGLVKSITGNEVTILKIERPQAVEGENIDGQNTKDSAASPVAFGSGTGTGGGGRVPGMGMGGGMRPEGTADQAAQMLERIKSMSSGEEKVLIPVGIQMLMPNSTDPGADPIEAVLSDIKSDKMVQIWLDESVVDRKVANFVMITR